MLPGRKHIATAITVQGRLQCIPAAYGFHRHIGCPELRSSGKAGTSYIVKHPVMLRPECQRITADRIHDDLNVTGIAGVSAFNQHRTLPPRSKRIIIICINTVPGSIELTPDSKCITGIITDHPGVTRITLIIGLNLHLAAALRCCGKRPAVIRTQRITGHVCQRP